MKTSAAIREYLIEIEVRKYTPKTIRGYLNSLNLFLRFCEQETHIQEVEEINLAVVRQFSAFMSQKGRKGSYINGLLKASKSFIQYCYDEGYGCGLSRPHVFCSLLDAVLWRISQKIAFFLL